MLFSLGRFRILKVLTNALVIDLVVARTTVELLPVHGLCLLLISGLVQGAIKVNYSLITNQLKLHCNLIYFQYMVDIKYHLLPRKLYKQIVKRNYETRKLSKKPITYGFNIRKHYLFLK